MDKKLTINLVTWNGEKYIPALFKSLSYQSFKNFELVVFDNASNDSTVELINKNTTDYNLSVKIIQNKNNIGFAAGHNRLFQEVKTEYFLIINQDLFLESNAIEKMIDFMDNNQDSMAVGPRVMKWNFANNQRTNIIDSLGLKIYRNRRVVEIGEGSEYQNQSVDKNFTKVFGLSGAVILFRTIFVKDLGYFLDEALESYKEDVDLAYRINLFGKESFLLNDAVVYHDRTGGGTKHKDDLNSIFNKSKQSFLVKYNSYRNHLLVLYKNEFWQNFILDFPWIFWYEFKKFIYFLIFDRKILNGLKEFKNNRSAITKQRQDNIKRAKITWHDFRYWLK